MKKGQKIIKVDKSLAKEIEEIAGTYGVTHIEASKILLRKVKEKKNSKFYHL